MKMPSIKRITKHLRNIRDWSGASPRDLFSYPYLKLKELVQEFDKSANPPQVLYFGDSVLERVANEDHDRRPLKQMLLDEITTRYKGISISHSAYDVRLFYYFLAAIERMKHKPKIVILPINIRCFSPQWDLQPKWQYEEELAILKKFLEKPGSKIGSVSRRSQSEIVSRQTELFEATSVNYPMTSLDRISQFVKLIKSKPATDDEIAYRKQQIFIYHYMHPLSHNHRKVLALMDTVSLLARMAVKSIIYLTPINMEAGVSYVGDAFREQVNANIEVLSSQVMKSLDQTMQRFHDYSALCASQAFFQDNLATEHLNAAGRRNLAHLLATETLHL